MPKNKNKSGRPKGPPPHIAALIESRRRGKGKPKDGLLQQILAERGQSSSPAARAHGHTSLADEARNTAFNRRGKMGIDAKLRFRPVHFVSAGFMDPQKDPDYNQRPPSPQPVDSLENHASGEEIQNADGQALAAPEENTAAPLEAPAAASPVQAKEDSPAADFLIDVTGDSSLRPTVRSTPDADSATAPSNAEPAPAHRTNPDPESSDEEIILFKGRDERPRTSDPSRSPAKAPPNNAPPKKSKQDSMQLEAITKELKIVESSIEAETSWGDAPDRKTDAERGTPTLSKARERPPKQSEPEQHISFTPPKTRNRRGPKHFPESDASNEEAAIIADYIANTKDSDDDANATGEDIRGHSGTMPHAFHTLRDIGGTDSDAVPDQATSEAKSDDSSGESEDADLDDAELRQQRVAEDERIARLLAKQEQLGLNSSEVILLDSEDPEDGEGDEWQTAPKGTPRRRKKGSSKAAKVTRHQNFYSSATEFAEAFDDLDLMDWQRPSLNNFNFNSNKKRGPIFDISDSELEEAMNETWQKDRLKKADKKKAREELRAQGLLGRNVNPDDMRVKYSGGMSIDDLADELETFLTGDQEQLSLPPFDKRSRMTVHEIANKLKLKSQSAGKGNSRHTVLFRTRRTLKYEQVSFDRTLARVRQAWFPRVDVDEEVAKQAKIFRKPEVRSKSRGQSSLTYREGDIVGHDAAELGTENKGRAMLEKMGWAKGMSLGSEENKGIVVPLTHVMKKSKLGLGEI